MRGIELQEEIEDLVVRSHGGDHLNTASGNVDSPVRVCVSVWRVFVAHQLRLQRPHDYTRHAFKHIAKGGSGSIRLADWEAAVAEVAPWVQRQASLDAFAALADPCHGGMDLRRFAAILDCHL